MSHTSDINLKINSIEALRRVCDKLGWEMNENGSATFYDGKKRDGITVKLPGWRYAVVINREEGKVLFDNYNGSWGNIKHLNKLKAHYAIEYGKIQARRMGYTTVYQENNEGELVLTVNVE